MLRACSKKGNIWGSVEALRGFSTIRACFKEGEAGALCPCPEAGKVEERQVAEVLSWGTPWPFSPLPSRKSGLALGGV